MEVLLELTHQDMSDVVLRRVGARRHVARFVQVRQLRGARETGRHLEDPELPGRMKGEWTPDGNHPNVEGHRRLGELAFALR